MAATSRHLTLIAILLTYTAAALWYATATPPLEAGDEMLHFFAVRQIANGEGLPVLDPRDQRADSPHQEAGQPPLYHLLASRLFAGLNTDDIRALAPNPHAFIGMPSTDPVNKNRVVHPPDEGNLRSITALNRARLLSIAFGLLTVLLTYLLARRVGQGEPGLALLAASLVAFNPMFLFISASVANDTAIAALCTGALLLLLPAASGRLTYRRTGLLGVILGAAALTKLSGLGLIPLALGAFVGGALARRARGQRPGARHLTPDPQPPTLAVVARHAGVMLALAAGVAGWWYARNLSLYGDPTGLNAWLRLVGTRTQPLDLQELKGLWMAFWGIFGPFDILAEPWVYASYAGLCIAAVAGWAVTLVRRGRARQASPLPVHPMALVVLVAWLGIEAIALTRWTSLNMASSGRLLFPAIGSIAILLALGLLLPLRQSARFSAACVGAVVLALIAAVIPLQSILPAYRGAPRATEADLGSAATQPRVVFGDALELAAASVAPVTPLGQPVRVELFWRSLRPIPDNYSMGIHVIGRDGIRLGQLDMYPGAGRYPTSRWRPGDIIKDAVQVQLAAPPDSPAGARVVVSLYRFGDQATLKATTQSGGEVYPVLVGTTELAPQPRCHDGVADGLFDSAMGLVSASPRPDAIRAGDTLNLTLVWCATARPPNDYTVFLHLAHPGQPPVAQHDGPPRHGAHPTSAWARGELVQDVRTLRVASNTAPGTYRLLVGLYDPRTGRRLQTQSGKDAADLGPLTIEPAQGRTIRVG